MAGLTLLSRALMSKEMFQIDRDVVPVPFREEVRERVGERQFEREGDGKRGYCSSWMGIWFQYCLGRR